MKRSSWLLRGLVGVSLSAVLLTSVGWLGQLAAADTPNGSFSYDPSSLEPVIFTDGLGGPFNRSFTVSAPKDQQSPNIDVNFKIAEIVKVAEDDGTADGAALKPSIIIDPKSDQYATLAGVVSFSPTTAKLSPGSSTTIELKLSTPGYGNFGYYRIKFVAQGTGVNPGPGSSILLKLRAPDPFEH